MSNARSIADLLGKAGEFSDTEVVLGDSSDTRLFIPGVGLDTNLATDNSSPVWNASTGKFTFSPVGTGTNVYDSASSLPITGVSAGQQAFAKDTNRLYIYNGSGWYSVAMINRTPTITSTLNAGYNLDSNGGTPTTITILAQDSDGIPLSYSSLASDSASDLATITQGTGDSSNVFTIQAKTLADILSAGYDSSGGTFSVTFTASDGISIDTESSSFTISFSLTYPEPSGNVTNSTYIGEATAVSMQRGYSVDVNNFVYGVNISNVTLYKWDGQSFIDSQTNNTPSSVTIPGTKTNSHWMAPAISIDGNYVYIPDTSNSTFIMKRFPLTTPYDISTIQSSDKSSSSFSTGGYVYSTSISSDGIYMYVGTEQYRLTQYTMSTPWDPSTMSETGWYSTTSYNAAYMHPNGGRALLVSYGSNNFVEVIWQTPHNLGSSATTSNAISTGMTQSLMAAYSYDGEYYWIGSQDGSQRIRLYQFN